MGRNRKVEETAGLIKEKIMGIDFSHGRARWSYIGFHNFRSRIAESAGLDLEKLYNLNGPWDMIEEGLRPFLNHSDRDGDLTVEELKLIAPRLKEIVTSWSDDTLDEEFNKKEGLKLVEGMEAAIEANEPLEFC